MMVRYVFVSDECEDAAHDVCALAMCECVCHLSAKRLAHDLRQMIAILALMAVMWGAIAILAFIVIKMMS